MGVEGEEGEVGCEEGAEAGGVGAEDASCEFDLAGFVLDGLVLFGRGREVTLTTRRLYSVVCM